MADAFRPIDGQVGLCKHITAYHSIPPAICKHITAYTASNLMLQLCTGYNDNAPQDGSSSYRK